jgi:hypothetical protein
LIHVPLAGIATVSAAMPPDGRPERTLTATANLPTILRIFNPYHKMDPAADLRHVEELPLIDELGPVTHLRFVTTFVLTDGQAERKITAHLIIPKEARGSDAALQRTDRQRTSPSLMSQ